jgi:mannose-6-phosphate isomerase-like protein (cupin superfamily)
MVVTFLKLLASFAGVYVLTGALLHYWVFPEPSPGPSSQPAAGDEIVNRLSGERLVFLRTGCETGGSYTENELHLQPGGAVPKAHIHLNEDETFEIVSGHLTLMENGRELVLGPGDSHTVPKGVAHQPFNRGSEPVVARVRITPAGRMDLMLAQVHGFLTEKATPRTEWEWFMQAMLYSAYYGTYLAQPPVTVQKLLSFLVSPTARLLGYRSWYPAYSQKWKRSCCGAGCSASSWPATPKQPA